MSWLLISGGLGKFDGMLTICTRSAGARHCVIHPVISTYKLGILLSSSLDLLSKLPEPLVGSVWNHDTGLLGPTSCGSWLHLPGRSRCLFV